MLKRLALLHAIAAAPAAAQQAAAGGHDQHAKPALDAELAEHFKGITLTDAQVRQVTEIKAKHHRAMEQLRANPAGRDSTALAAEIKKHMDAEHHEFMALLTEEQKKVFEQNMAGHHRAEGRPAMEHGDHAAPRATPRAAPAPAPAPPATKKPPVR